MRRAVVALRLPQRTDASGSLQKETEMRLREARLLAPWLGYEIDLGRPCFADRISRIAADIARAAIPSAGPDRLILTVIDGATGRRTRFSR